MKPHPVKFQRLFKAVFIVILFTASCAPVKPELTAEPVTTASPEPTRVVDANTPALTAEPVAMSSPTPESLQITVTPSAIATMPPVFDDTVTWAEGLNVKWAEGFYDSGGWSPSRNEAFYHLVEDSPDTVLVRYAAPDFQAQEIRAPAIVQQDPLRKCWPTNILWSPEGQRVYFGGPATDPADIRSESCNLWLVEHDGTSLRSYYPKMIGRSLSFAWLDNHTMTFDGYREAIRIVDLLTGKVLNRAFPYGGNILFSRDYLVGTDDPFQGTPYHVYALGRRDKPVDLTGNYETIGLRYARQFPSKAVSTYLNDIVPDTNQVLAYWYEQKVEYTDSDNFNYSIIHKLVIWDIDTDAVIPVVPYAIYGKINPDKHTLAYFTYGPAQLDDNHKPVSSQNNDSGNQIYLQLYDMKTHAVFLSVPIIGTEDYYNPSSYKMGTNFSPDGRYLTFFADHEIELDQNGWPVLTQAPAVSSDGTYLYVFDLKNRTLVWSCSDSRPLIETSDTINFDNSMPTWSPDSNKFTYLDEDSQINLVDLGKRTNRLLTTSVYGIPKVEWSHDGSYLAIQFQEQKVYKNKIAFLQAP